VGRGGAGYHISGQVRKSRVHVSCLVAVPSTGDSKMQISPPATSSKQTSVMCFDVIFLFIFSPSSLSLVLPPSTVQPLSSPHRRSLPFHSKRLLITLSIVFFFSDTPLLRSPYPGSLVWPPDKSHIIILASAPPTLPRFITFLSSEYHSLFLS
jgi:hypothetical protein